VTHGLGASAFILLDERYDIRIRVEAVLAHYFHRAIKIAWTRGNLTITATSPAGKEYDFIRDECHGIKELAILLSFLFDDEIDYLIIDEPELNLHPQYQAFLMQRMRRIAGDPDIDHGKKVIFVVTHSPFCLDLRTVDDIRSVVSFTPDFTVPKAMYDLPDDQLDDIVGLLPYLSVHHKQFFFSDHPVFVEGLHDARLIAAMQAARGISAEAAGSCVIDVGGKEQVSKYLILCQRLGKKAYFLYDLDSIFFGTLKASIRKDDVVADFLARLGIGTGLVKVLGELYKSLGELAKGIKDLAVDGGKLADLRRRIKKEEVDGSFGREQLQRVRYMVAIYISGGGELPDEFSSERKFALGRQEAIIRALQSRDILVLPGGALENYLPAYEGDVYWITEGAKTLAIEAELKWLADMRALEAGAERYGALWNIVGELPGEASIDVLEAAREAIADAIYQIQMGVVKGEISDVETANSCLKLKTGLERIVVVEEFQRTQDNEFRAKLKLAVEFVGEERVVEFSRATVAGMLKFDVRRSEP
jgi:hypothetical protein